MRTLMTVAFSLAQAFAPGSVRLRLILEPIYGLSRMSAEQFNESLLKEAYEDVLFSIPKRERLG